MKFLVKELGKFKKFVRLHFYQFYPKSEEKRRTNISKKDLHILETQFDFYCIFMHEYFSDIKFWYFSPSKSSILALKNPFFNTGKFLVCIPCEEFLVIKFLVPHEEWWHVIGSNFLLMAFFSSVLLVGTHFQKRLFNWQVLIKPNTMCGCNFSTRNFDILIVKGSLKNGQNSKLCMLNNILCME